MADPLAFEKTFKFRIPDKPVRSCTWAELHETRSKLKKGMDALLDVLEKENRDMDSIEKRAFDDAVTAVDCIQGEFDAREAEGSKEPRNIRIGGGPDKKAPEAECRKGGVGMSFRDLYGEGDWGGYRDANDYWTCVVSNTMPAEARSFQVGVGVQGGFATPTQYIAQLWRDVETLSAFLPYTMNIRMDAMQAVWPKWRSEDRASGSTGQFMGNWGAEGSTFSEVDAEIGSMTLTAKKLAVYLSATRELLADSVGIAPVLGGIMVENLTYILDRAIYNGSGVGQPLGILNSPAKIKVARAAANAISLTDVIGMFQRLHPQFFNGAIWFVSPSACAALITLQDSGSNSLWVSNAAGPIPGSLFGIPVRVNEHSAAIGTEGDIILANLKTYCVARRQEATVEQSQSVHWTTDKTAFRATLRVDGQPLLDRVITPISGNTLSSIITLG